MERHNLLCSNTFTHLSMAYRGTHIDLLLRLPRVGSSTPEHVLAFLRNIHFDFFFSWKLGCKYKKSSQGHFVTPSCNSDDAQTENAKLLLGFLA